MAEDIGPRYTVELLDIISGAGNEQKENRAGYLLCPGPLVKLTSLVPGERVLIPTSYQWYHCVWRYQPTQCITVQRQTITILIVWAAWKVNYSLGMFEHGMSYDCDAGSCYQPRDNTWHVTQTLRDANTSVIYGNNPRVRRSGPRAGTNEGRAGTQHPSRPQGSWCQYFAQIVLAPAGAMSVWTIWRPPVTRLWPFLWHRARLSRDMPRPGGPCAAQI